MKEAELMEGPPVVAMRRQFEEIYKAALTMHEEGNTMLTIASNILGATSGSAIQFYEKNGGSLEIADAIIRAFVTNVLAVRIMLDHVHKVGDQNEAMRTLAAVYIAKVDGLEERAKILAAVDAAAAGRAL